MALKNRFERIARGEGARLLGFNPLPGHAPDGAARFLHVHPDQIERDPTQPRKELGDLEGLSTSIKDQGILQPLIVTPLDDRRYQLLAGERRLTAARQAGLTEVPVLVRAVEEHARLVLQIVENLHRKDLSPVEEAEGVRRLMDESGLSQRDVAARLGKSLTYINELLRVLALPADVLDGVRTSEQSISKSLLLEITKQADEDKQRQLWKRVRSGEGLTVKEARGQKRGDKPAASKERAKGEADLAQDRAKGMASMSSGAMADWVLRTKVGVVHVRLDGGNPQDQSQLRQALEEALQSVNRMGELAERS